MFDHSITGIRNHLEMMDLAARRIQDAENADLPKEMVNLMIAEKGAKANISALRTSLSMQQSIMDLFA